MNDRWLGPLLILLALPIHCLLAETLPVFSSVRTTNDLDLDLIDALVRFNRFEDALKICDLGSRNAEPLSDRAAKWAIQKSNVLTDRELNGQHFGEAEIATSLGPVTELITAYPNHPRALFLQAQTANVRREAAKYQVVRASISSDDKAKELAIKSLVQATTVTRELSKRIADERSRMHNQPQPVVGIDSDLNRLQQELNVNVASLILMQTELFVRGSDDCVAAATKAEQAINNAIERIPTNTPARIEMERLKVESILRAGQVERAVAEFDSAFKSTSDPPSLALLPLQIRLRIAEGDQQHSAALLSEFYSNAPEQAPRSMEMDLARLEYLLSFDKAQVGSWFEAIEQRGGQYARRRGEAIAISRIGDEGQSAVDPALLAVAGRDLLRKGDPVRAGELLAASARVDKNPDHAIRHAAEAAAAFASAGRTENAAKTLIDITVTHKDAKGAAEANLQAIYLLRFLNPERVEQLLQTHLNDWPSGPAARSARDWLHKHLSDQGRFLDAAIVVSGCPVAELTEDRAATIGSAWRTAFHESTDPTLAEPTRQFRESMRQLLDSPWIRSQYRPLASMLLNRDSLAGLPEGSAADPFVNGFINFRRQGTITPGLATVPDEYAADARWRLIRDGRSLPQLRPAIAKLLQQWDREAEPTFEKAELLLWSSDIGESIAMLNNLIAGSKQDLETVKRAANLLGRSDVREAQQQAIRLWDRVAAGTPKGTPLWHEAKLAAIECLRKTGDRESADKRVKYILLTMPNINADWKSKYQAMLP